LSRNEPYHRERTFSALLAIAIDAVRINQTTVVTRDGRPFLLKRRRGGRGLIIAAGNVFLRLSHSRIVMFPNVRGWQAWELASFRLLYGDSYRYEAVGRDAVLTERLPGTDIRTLLAQDRLTDAALRAAGQVFREAHALHSNYWELDWSHGDPHLGNVLYDSEQQRAFLIDFETRHEFALSANERHADDLLTFLLKLMGSDHTGRWQGWSQRFLEAYDNPVVMPYLRKRLTVPFGLERVLWHTRTNHLPVFELRTRLMLLKALTETLC